MLRSRPKLCSRPTCTHQGRSLPTIQVASGTDRKGPPELFRPACRLSLPNHGITWVTGLRGYVIYGLRGHGVKRLWESMSKGIKPLAAGKF